MIRSNLSTRPFYNERAVQLWLLVLALIVAVATFFNVFRMIRYSRTDTELASQALRDEARATDLREEASRLRGSVDLQQIELASTEARQANALIDRRTFSWTDLFNQFETTFPDNVRIMAVKPTLDEKGGLVLTINVVARSVDDVDELIRNLEGTGSFTNLLSVEEHFNTDAMLEATLEGNYMPRPATPAAEGEKTMTLLQRILREKRPILVPLFVALLANVAAYALVVRPLGVRSATAADRAQAAATSLKTAEADRDAARALVAGKTLAEQELATFYGKVLPADLSAARRMTYAALPALARKTNVKYDASRTEIEVVKNQRIGRLRISMVLEGDYENVRQFIYELETTPAFVIIDDVTLAQNDPNQPLALSLELSAYYRTGRNGD